MAYGPTPYAPPIQTAGMPFPRPVILDPSMLSQAQAPMASLPGRLSGTALNARLLNAPAYTPPTSPLALGPAPAHSLPPTTPYPSPTGIGNVNTATSVGRLYEGGRPGAPTPAASTGRFAGLNASLPGNLSLGSRANLLGRGLGSALLYQNLGQMTSSALGGNDTDAGAMASAAGTTGALGSAAYGLGSAAGVVGGASAAAVGGAAAAGGLIAEGIARLAGDAGPFEEGDSLTNVGGNIGRKLSSGPGSLGNNMATFAQVGIMPSDIATALQSENGESLFAQSLVDAGIEGAKIEDGKIELSGGALASMEEFRALHGADDPFSKMMRDMIGEGAAPEMIDQAALAFSGLTSGDDAISPEEAVAGIRGDLETVAAETTAAQEAERSYMANQLLLQQKAQEYMAPITGQMRQQADANYAMMEGLVGTMNLPPGMGEAMLLQAQGERTMQQATAAAYDNQMMVAGPVAAQQEYQQSMEGLAAQLMQQQQAQYIQSLTDPMAGMAQNPYATALQPQVDPYAMLTG